MKSKLNMVAWSFATAAAVYVAVGPGVGILYHNPLACFGVGLIGLGMCMDGQRRLQATSAHSS